MVLETAAEFDSFSFDTCLYLGHCYCRTENWPLALHNYRNAAGIAPEHSDCFYYIGFCFNKMGNKDKALRALNVASEMGHSDAKALLENLKS
jgi:tetratricopeptide (TPR) repeat protein